MKKFIVLNTLKETKEFYILEAENLDMAQMDVCNTHPKMVPGMNIIEIDEKSTINLGEDRVTVNGKPGGDFLCMDIYTTAADLRFILTHPETVKEF